MTPSNPSTVSSAAEQRQAAVLLEDTFARYQSELLGTMYLIVGNREDARDALQESFLKCWRNIDQVPDITNVKAWVFRIALNTARDLCKAAWRRRRASLPGDTDVLPSDQPPPGRQLEQDEQLQRVRAAIADLRPEEQDVFLLRQNGELTYEQIADALRIPSGTVKTRMRLALSRLRAALPAE